MAGRTGGLQLQDLSRGRFRALEYTFLDTAFSTPGFLLHARRPRLHGRGPDGHPPGGPDLRHARHGHLPLGTAGLAPTRCALVRRMAAPRICPPRPIRSHPDSRVGPRADGCGPRPRGWGGTYVPLRFECPSREVRQGRPGGQLVVSTRWLALPGTGGRMAFGVHWHRTF